MYCREFSTRTHVHVVAYPVGMPVPECFQSKVDLFECLLVYHTIVADCGRLRSNQS